MKRRSICNVVRAQSFNVGLLVGLGIVGCGEAHQSTIEPEPNGTVGTLKVLLASYADHSETLYRLIKDDGEDIGLNFGSEAPRLRVGERIAVRGERQGDRIQVNGYELVQRRVGDTQQRLLTGSHDPQTMRVAAISLTTVTTKATLTKRVFQDVDSPTAFYRDNSYGTWNFTGESYGPYTLTTTSCADSNLYVIAAQAAAAAKADGFDPDNYENVMYFVPSSLGCSWGGVAEVGTNPARGFWNAKHSWYAGTGCVVLAQELGHNYGLLHSHRCTAPPYNNGASYGGASCTAYDEYGDKYSPMGGGCGHFNSPEMGAMKYISGCNTIDVTSSGTFEIGPIEQKCAGPQVIRVVGAPNMNRGQQYIYAEYRLGKGTVGSDRTSPKGLHMYASAEYGGNATGIVSDMHDLDYAVDPFSIKDPPIAEGGSWTEPDSMATFTLMTAGQTATVQVTIPNGNGSAPQCVGGGAPPVLPMCGAVTDAGTPDSGTGGTGGGSADASTDVGKDGTAGTAGSGGTAGTAGAAGTGGGAGSAGTAGTAGAAGTGGAAGKGGTGGTAGSAATGGSAGTTGGSAGSGTGGSAGAAGGASGAGGSAGAGTAGKGGTGGSGTGGSGTGGSTTGGSTPPPEEGCSCSIPGGNGSTRTPALLLGLAALVPALRRKRRARATR
ncbi:MAG TPA: MYXO-CTERM sorting domain-containing protein [Polyangiaceae bacterium]|nr:MYXO-CTERM sorting domain-containing protein [Polyangiaceae bacterium]